MKHAMLSPSSAARWTRCPGSARMVFGLPPTSNKYAAEGSALHEEAAACLLAGTPPSEEVAQYVDAVREACATVIDPELLVEQPVPIGHVTGEDGAVGFPDAVVHGRDELFVFDLKTGRTPVPAEQNEQLLLYALGAQRARLDANKPAARLVTMVICQPALYDAPLRWCLSGEELEDWAGSLRAAAAAALAPDAPLVPGDVQCRWCPAAGVCPALESEVDGAVQAGVPARSPSEWGRAVDRVPLARAWADAVEAEAVARLTRGELVEGYELAPGRAGPRRWKNEEAAERVLRAVLGCTADLKRAKLVSPAQAEKLVRAVAPSEWAGVAEELVERPAPSLTLRRISNDFSNLTEED